MEEKTQGQFFMSLQRYDGVQVHIQVRQKSSHIKKRHVKGWTMQEDQLLMNLYTAYPKKWAVIASLMTERNENQCLHRYRRISKLDAHQKIWSSEEDETINKLMKKIGKNWKLLSELLGTKTGKQIRQRFINKLDPKINKEDWSDEQDRKIIELYTKIGRKWSTISKHLPGRPENKIKNRFYSYIQKNYDITSHPIGEKNIEMLGLSTDKQEGKSLIKIDPLSKRQMQLREITSKIHNGIGSIEQISKEEKFFVYSFPSINQMELDIRMDDRQNQCSRSMVRSMMKVDEEWMDKEKMNDFEPHVEAQNDLFYLSN